MSVIETPPKDRMAIQTIVAKFDEKLIRTAIEMELERGGQIYFVHNRVETIYELAAKIRELVPQARIVIGHGQLPEAELERVMLAFMNHEYDVLRRNLASSKTASTFRSPTPSSSTAPTAMASANYINSAAAWAAAIAALTRTC